MYAVMITGGKQYRVEKDQLLKVEKLPLDVGGSINFEQILLVKQGEGTKIGQPYVTGAKVSAEIVSHGRGKKIKIIKFKRRKHHMKRMGHRQDYTVIKVIDIAG